MPFAASSFLLLVVRPGAPSNVLGPKDMGIGMSHEYRTFLTPLCMWFLRVSGEYRLGLGFFTMDIVKLLP